MSLTTIQDSDYIVYVDESGDHSLEPVNPRYPLFVLSFCVFQKTSYSYEIAPALRMLKFAMFGHDMVIFHEHEIRKKRGAFSHLCRERREDLILALSNLINCCDLREKVVSR